MRDSSSDLQTPSKARYALVLKTYTWDAFVQRQAWRLMNSSRSGDFFVWVDETQSKVGPIPFDRVIRTSRERMIAAGWPDRCEKGAYFWWNADYPHYNFFAEEPDYPFYVFVEYDALIVGNIDDLVQRMLDRQIDFAALPQRQILESWPFTEGHLKIYSEQDLRFSLVCVTVQSRRALEKLRDRRLGMGKQPTLPYWPSGEAFLPTEVERAGLTSASLEEFGDVSCFAWRPPHHERAVLSRPGPAFIHPVYDMKRYLKWAITSGPTIRMLLSRDQPASEFPGKTPWSTRSLLWLCAIARAIQSAFRTPAQLSGPTT